MPISVHCYNKIPEKNQLKGGKAYLRLTVPVAFVYESHGPLTLAFGPIAGQNSMAGSVP